MKWHQDGHSFEVVVDKASVQISDFHCPSRSEESAECKPGEECIVERFMLEYGFDCNVGVSVINGRMEIAWTVVGDTKDYATCQVWVIPVNDEFFAAWSDGKREELQKKE